MAAVDSTVIDDLAVNSAVDSVVVDDWSYVNLAVDSLDVDSLGLRRE